MVLTKNHRIMKRINTTTRYLLLILAAAILNCLLDGTMNLIVTIFLCLALIPTARRMDRESRNQ
nr:MAG TPA: hypothetical protein [Caudoviricetes sp.]